MHFVSTVNPCQLHYILARFPVGNRLLYLHNAQWIHTVAKIYKNTYNMNYVQMIN